jgi:hypothetical protein
MGLGWRQLGTRRLRRGDSGHARWRSNFYVTRAHFCLKSIGQNSASSTCFAGPGAYLLPPSLNHSPGRPERSPALYSSPQQPLAGFFFALRRFHAFDSIPAHTTKLLIAAQWALTGFGLFCLVGAAVVIALTPEAWPL